MNKQIILPKTYIDGITTSTIFLAGPSRSTYDWQSEAIRILLDLQSDLTIVNPKRAVQGDLIKRVIEGDNTHFSRQRAWERHYLNLASKTGCIMFWLPEETEHSCKKVYGAMTRVEIRQWMTNYKHDNSVRFCVGSDGKFQELHTIVYDLSIDAPSKIVLPTLEQTCQEAIKLATQHQ